MPSGRDARTMPERAQSHAAKGPGAMRERHRRALDPSAQASAAPGESYPPPGTLASKDRSVEHFGENRFADHISCVT